MEDYVENQVFLERTSIFLFFARKEIVPVHLDIFAGVFPRYEARTKEPTRYI